MANGIQLSGFDELRAELAALPTTLRGESDPILAAYARRAQTAVVAAYPSVTGALRGGVRLIQRVARGTAALYTVASTAPHAHLFEFGTHRARAHATFLPITEEYRRASVVDVAAAVEAHGLTVRGAKT